jgi:AraC-like DNA-binding protein
MEHIVIAIEGLTLFEKAGMPDGSGYDGPLNNSACFMYMLQGSNKATDSEGSTVIHSTEGIIKRCGNYVSQFSTQDTEASICEAVAIYFHPGFIKNIYKNEIPNFLYKSNTLPSTRKIASNEFIQQYIQNLLPYFNEPELMDKDLAELKIKELILLLLKSENRTSVLDYFSELFASPAQTSLKDIIENNIFNDISLEQLAFLCNKSLSTFKREFKKVYKEAPATYIRSQRIERAKLLLSTTDMRVKEIAYNIGFNELSSFSHTFQKVSGLSPSDFRLTQTNK